ncbi:aromatic-ring-hydroxylating dioxygenase subunit beta [Niallia sp. Krafla_26]|uniref:aromatic-ring-hydroxylating dioxygenase subunit beta n=1 Tax=Niallia sp. Krafla_26 TaxID=3064703 RepID=UPI003D164106
MTSVTQPSNVELYLEITNLLNQEAYYLDNGMYKEWLELLTDDLNYLMPLRETVEGVGVNNIAKDTQFFNETKTALVTRVNRLYTKSAWVENPATRQRHFISNIMIEGTDHPNEYKVTSYFHFMRNRGSHHEIEQLFGQRHDLIRKTDSGWKIAKRTIIPDQAVLTTMNLSMFL